MSNMEWCNCPKCNHKLFRYNPNVSNNWNWEMEIKCSSCKSVVGVVFSNQWIQYRIAKEKEKRG